jgi:hypothetical protein
MGGRLRLESVATLVWNTHQNVISCRFEFGEPVIDGKHVALPWIMTLRHKRISRGRRITVDGISHLEIRDGLVTFHRDYFDAGQLLYENLPALGRIIRWIKGHAG